MTPDPLITASLLGTARVQALPPAPASEIAVEWQAIPRDNPAAALLHALALMRALHRAGANTQSAPLSTVQTCPSETRALLSPGAVDVARRLLAGEAREFLPEWLKHATTSGKILPARLLPDFLSSATRNPGLRPAASALAGERGLWLARRHPEFSWLLESTTPQESAWDDGTPFERIAWLRHLRVSDPARAAEIITTQWPAEDAPMRESILRLVAENPHPRDETWLESAALRDRRQEIRALATASLMEIPGTAFRARAVARLCNHVKIQRRLLKRIISIEPPAAFDPEWAADGIKEKPPAGTGEKAWWLQQMISRIPLDQWPALLGISQDELFTLTRDEDWGKVLIAGWIESAERHPTRALADRFIPFLAPMNPWPNPAIPKSQVIKTILKKLPAPAQFTILDHLAKTTERLKRPVVLDFLAHVGTHPPQGQGEAVLDALQAELGANDCFLNRAQARALSGCIPPAEIQPTLERLAKLPTLTTAAEEFATALEFRKFMLSQLITP